jgi:hypothetical protein
MSRDSEFFRANAAEASAQADAATLDNVRDRCLRSAAAWSAMAERSERIEQARNARAMAPDLLVQGSV